MSRDRFEQHRARVTELYEDLYAEIHELKLLLIEKPKEFSQPEMVDISWSMKQCEKVLKELCVRYTEIREKTLAQIICLRYVDDTVNDLTIKPIHGELATGSPHVGEMHAVPKRGTPEFNLLANELGVPKGNERLFNLHWPSLVELITERKRLGRPIPKILSDSEKTYPIYTVKLRKKGNKDA